MDRLAAGVLAALAIWVLASGLDDLVLDVGYLYYRLTARRRRPPADLPRAGKAVEKRVALLIPAWREEAVIEQMLEHNLAAIQYSNYEVFVGAYPNDLPTLARLRTFAERHPKVHVVVCPHDGPTSKGDCLNWTYQAMLLYEETDARRFDVVLHHDAEDLIHPHSLLWINHYSDRYDMVQVPVLPLRTPWRDFTHGVYCDEFAQTQSKDLYVRMRWGGFLPSSGVGTAYRREALDRVAWIQQERIFLPELLAEDYHMGLEIHRLGCSQFLLDAEALADGREPAATREYFPRRWRPAVRQRARWIAGIALQGWRRVGWDAGPGQWYWLWRDRKGLLGHPLALAANLTFLYGLGGWAWSVWTATEWRLGTLVAGTPVLKWLLAINTGFILWRQAVRVASTRRFYGWRFAAAAPLRALWGNAINFAATVRALRLVVAPRWLKTDHTYPTAGAVRRQKRRLGEVLVDLGVAGPEAIELALQQKPAGERIGEHLLRTGVIAEDDLYRALSVQCSLPFERDPSPEPDAFTRVPARLADYWKLLPLQVADERYLWLAGPEPPPEEARGDIAAATGLEPRFVFITPTRYRELRAAVNWPARTASASLPSSLRPRGSPGR